LMEVIHSSASNVIACGFSRKERYSTIKQTADYQK
jgi:hypothetical protein